jgi:membrane-bound metal-dependent hydrolase YbcI (DUF457 family)
MPFGKPTQIATPRMRPCQHDKIQPMNYTQHTLIGVGTAGLGLLTAEALGAPPAALITLIVGTAMAGLGSVAVDIDHPRSFIGRTVPFKVARLAGTILAVPLVAALGTLLTTRNAPDTWMQIWNLIMGLTFLRWLLIIFIAALAIMGLSWFLFHTISHRGPLHSLAFTAGITSAVCLVFWSIGAPWIWGVVFGWGWLWHILADGLTEAGVPLFWPINNNRLHVLPEWARGLGKVLLYLAAFGGIFGMIYLRLRPFFG